MSSSNQKQIHHRRHHHSHQVPQQHQQYRQLCQQQLPSYSSGNLPTLYESEGEEDDIMNSKILHENNYYYKSAKVSPELKKRFMQQNHVASTQPRPMQSSLRDAGPTYKPDQNINGIRRKYVMCYLKKIYIYS